MSKPEEKETENGTVMQYGSCKFCGQTHPFETIGMATEEQLDEWATEKCSCSEAKEQREMKESEDRAVKNIERLFGQYDAGAILKAAVHSVAICAVDSVTVNVGNGVKGELKLSNSKVVVKKTVTETDTLEA